MSSGESVERAPAPVVDDVFYCISHKLLTLFNYGPIIPKKEALVHRAPLTFFHFFCSAVGYQRLATKNNLSRWLSTLIAIIYANHHDNEYAAEDII